jgi:hypothetical protein
MAQVESLLFEVLGGWQGIPDAQSALLNALHVRHAQYAHAPDACWRCVAPRTAQSVASAGPMLVLVPVHAFSSHAPIG